MYLSLCAISLGYIFGMWGNTATIMSAVAMMFVGGVVLDVVRRRYLNQTSLQSQPDDVISDIQQMRRFVDVQSMNDDVVTTHYSEAVTEALIDFAIEKASVDVFLQPVVTLPQRKMVMMEVFARLRAGNGQSLSASQYMEIAKEKKLQVRLDNLLLKQGLLAIENDASRAIDVSYMLNIGESSLQDGAFMKDVLAFLKGKPHLAPHLIFEIAQSDLIQMKDTSRFVLNSLAKLGCGVSMDQVENPHIDRAQLRDLGVQYIKISSARLQEFAKSDEGVAVMRRVQAGLSQEGIVMIADKIETDAILCEILDLEIQYGQGYLFGKPDRESVYDRSRKQA